MSQLIFSKKCLSKIDVPLIFNFSIEIEPKVFTEKDMVILTGGWFTFLTSSGVIIEESTYLIRHIIFEKMSKTKNVKKLEGEWIICGNFLTETEFYHWLYQAFSQLLLLKNRGYNLSNYNILISKRASWATAYLKKIGVTNVLEIDEQTLFVVESATFSNILWGDFTHCPSIEMLDSFNSIKSTHSSPTPAKIYISREDSKKRNVANEAELLLVLQDLGFSKIVMSECSIDEQIALFRNAEVIVSAHGAGLINLVFANSNVRVIELFPENYINKCFWAIAAKKNMTYTGLVNPVDLTGSDTGNLHSYRQVVDLNELRSLVCN
jgi:capsular polysaccharide biosynthesis protein